MEELAVEPELAIVAEPVDVDADVTATPLVVDSVVMLVAAAVLPPVDTAPSVGTSPVSFDAGALVDGSAKHPASSKTRPPTTTFARTPRPPERSDRVIHAMSRLYTSAPGTTAWTAGSADTALHLGGSGAGSVGRGQDTVIGEFLSLFADAPATNTRGGGSGTGEA